MTSVIEIRLGHGFFRGSAEAPSDGVTPRLRVHQRGLATLTQLCGVHPRESKPFGVRSSSRFGRCSRFRGPLKRRPSALGAPSPPQKLLSVVSSSARGRPAGRWSWTPRDPAGEISATASSGGVLEPQPEVGHHHDHGSRS